MRELITVLNLRVRRCTAPFPMSFKPLPSSRRPRAGSLTSQANATVLQSSRLYPKKFCPSSQQRISNSSITTSTSNLQSASLASRLPILSDNIFSLLRSLWLRQDGTIRILHIMRCLLALRRIVQTCLGQMDTLIPVRYVDMPRTLARLRTSYWSMMFPVSPQRASTSGNALWAVCAS